MCTSTTSRSRPACGTSTSGAVEATSPSSSTTAPSGIRSTTPARAAYDGRPGRGQEPGTAWTCTDQPASASSRHTRRSYALPPLGRAGSSMPSGTTTCTVVIALARRSPRRRATRGASRPARRAVHAGERRVVVEVGVVELGNDGVQLLRGPADVDHDAVGVEVDAAEGGVDDVRRPVEPLGGPEHLAPEAVGDHHVVSDGHAEHGLTPRRR